MTLSLLGAEAGAPIRFARPATPPLERVMDRLRPSYDEGILTNGPLVRRFEEEAADRLGVDHAVAVSCCTSGLILTLQAVAGPGPVVLPSFTFTASAHAVVWNGRAVRFAECDPDSMQLDVDDAAGLLDGAGGILATHVFGTPCRPEVVEKLAVESGLPLVFDAAHGFGATRAGRPLGSFGNAEVFSLSPTKLVAAGEGGVVATGDAALAERLRIGRDYGNPGDYDIRFVGLNARMSELHAALALESLAELDGHLARRRELAERYRAGLAALPGLRPQAIDDGDEPTFKDFTVAIDGERFGLDRDEVVQALGVEGIDTKRYFYPPVHRQTAYRGAADRPLPVTDRVAAMVVSLPMFRDLRDDEADRVVGAFAALHERAPDVRRALTERGSRG